jgi:Secretion system C-terminal sorting domain
VILEINSIFILDISFKNQMFKTKINFMHTKSNNTLLSILAKSTLASVENSFTTKKTTPMKKHLLQTAFFCLQFVLLTALALNTTAQTVVTFPTTTTWTCPAGVTSIKVECWGAGGAGGGATVAGSYSGGGGGGAYNVNNAIVVIPGNIYTITVGTGAAGTLVSGSAGGNSIFGSSLVTANGGAGGTTLAPGNGVGGAGGIGTFNGGTGGTGTTVTTKGTSGGGGGGAGSTGAGGNAALTVPGAAGTPDGGIGGLGRTTAVGSGNGNPGVALGGGGSGATASAASSRLGGNGANGQIKITFATPACVPPAVQPTALVLTPSSTSIAGSFTAAAGTDGYLVVMTTTSTAPTSPINGTTYTAGAAALGGTIISAGATTSFNATALTAATQYWFWVYGYNNLSCSGGIAYLATTPLTANATTTLPACTTPTGRPGSFSFTPITSNSITATFTASGSANSYLTIMTTTNTAPTNPVNGTTYIVGTSALGGTIVNASTSLTFTASGLTPNTQYWFWNFSYNDITCTGGPLYFTGSSRNSSATTNAISCVAPTAQPTSLILTPTNTTIAGSFTASASANSYLVVMTTSATAPTNPSNGTDYIVGTSALGGTIISASGSTSYTASALTPGTQYWFWIFAYNGVTCSGGSKYITSSPLTGNATTSLLPCATPTQQPTALILGPSSSTINVTFTPSIDATRYLVIRTATATSPTNPVDGTLYSVGTAALGGYVESVSSATTFISSSLTSPTQYWYWVFAYNGVTCSGAGPLYLTASPLTGSATTIACGAVNTALLTNSSNTTLNWSSLPWSLGHIPTSCETSEIILARASGSSSVQSIVVTLDQNISVINFLLTNASTVSTPTILETTGSVTVNVSGNMIITAPGANKYNRTVYANLVSTTVNGNLILGRAVPSATEGHSACGSGKNTTPNQAYNLYGDMVFNPRGYTTDEWSVFNFNKAGTQYLVNNTTATDTVYPVLFEKLNIGTTNATTLVFSGTTKDTYIEAERAGGVTVGVNSVLDLPANYNMNKLTVYSNFSEPLNLLAGAKLRLGGDKSINVAGATIGIAGSNFPSNFNTLNFNATSTVEYYGDNTLTQTIYNVPPYPNLLITNGAGVGRAQKITTAPITVNTSFNINALADVTLGTLGSSTATVVSTGPLNINANGGLYCNANVVSGVGAFTMGAGSFLGSGHASGITPLGTGIGNIQMTGARNYSIAGNYIYNGIVSQITNTGLPATVNDLTIDNPTTVTIAANQIVNGVHLLKQGTFDIGTTQIIINGLGTMNAVTGKMKANLGTVEMKGTSNQNLSGNWFLNKTISNLINTNLISTTIAASPADTLLISTKLSYGAVNNSIINTNNNLTILSRATGTANFADITNNGANSGNSIVGKVNIERYLFAKKAWRLLATPIAIGTSPTVTAAWRESNSALTSNGYGTQVTGPAGSPTFDQYTQRASIKSYDAATNNFIDVTNPSAQIANNAGYFVFVRGDRAVAVGGTTGVTNLRIKGDVRMGNQLFSVPANMFQSFGNPYPARIDFRTVTKTNIANAFTVWNPNNAGLYNVGAYETYTFNGTDYVKAGGIIRNYIESGEAVFVQSNSATAGTVTVHEADKGNGSALVSRVGVTRPTLEINLLAKDVDGSIYLADGVMLNFDNAYSSNVDNNDVRKIMNTADNLAVKNGNYNLVVERRPNLTANDTIKLSLTGVRVSPYRFEIDPSVLGNTGLEAILKDKFLQTETPISFTDVTSVPFDITATAASYAADRFMIVFKQAATTNFTTIAAIRNADKTVTVNWGTEGERNVTNYTLEQSNDGTNFTAIAVQTATANNGTNPTYSKLDAAASKANNWYRVKATNTNTTVKYTAIAMVGAVNEIVINAEAKMSIYPNPVVGGNVNLHLDNLVKGNYSVQITNAAGQTVKAENVQVENNNTLRTIKIGAAATGTYQATVIGEAGNKTTLSFLVK